MRQLVALFVMLITSSSLFAGQKSIALELKNRTLIVQKLVEKPEVVKYLKKKKPELLTVYSKNIQESNTLLRKSVGKYWKFNTTVIYKTKEEIAAMKVLESKKKKKERKNYAVMSLEFFSEKYKTREESAVITDVRYNNGDASYLFVRFWEGEEIVYMSSPRLIPHEADFVFMVRYLNHNVTGMEFNKDQTDLCKENGPQVRDKVLLVTQNQISKLKEKDLIKLYRYPYKVVDQSVIDKAIVSADPKYVCIISTDQSDTVVIKWLVLTGSGKLAGYHTDVKRPQLSKKDFKELGKFIK